MTRTAATHLAATIVFTHMSCIVQLCILFHVYVLSTPPLFFMFNSTFSQLSAIIKVTMISIIRMSHTAPSLPYEKIATAILGERYDLTLTFIGEVRARKLNTAHRKKTYIPNVLSFPLYAHVGEIYICPRVAQKEAPKFSMTTSGYIGYLFIHGCLHLKGYDHGATMERTEQKYVRQFKLG